MATGGWGGSSSRGACFSGRHLPAFSPPQPGCSVQDPPPGCPPSIPLFFRFLMKMDLRFACVIENKQTMNSFVDSAEPGFPDQGLQSGRPLSLFLPGTGCSPDASCSAACALGHALSSFQSPARPPCLAFQSPTAPHRGRSAPAVNTPVFCAGGYHSALPSLHVCSR